MVSCFPPAVFLRLVDGGSRDLNLARHDGDHAILVRIAHDADGILVALDGVDRFLKHAPKQDHALVRNTEMLAAAVEDRALTFLGAAVLIAARYPTGVFVPAVFSQYTIAQPFGGLIFRHFGRHLTVDHRR